MLSNLVFELFGCNCENPWVYLIASLSNFIRVLPFFLFEFDPLLLCFWFIRMVAFGFNGLVSGFTEDGCRFCELSSADFSALGCCWFDSPLLSFLFSCWCFVLRFSELLPLPLFRCCVQFKFCFGVSSPFPCCCVHALLGC